MSFWKYSVYSNITSNKYSPLKFYLLLLKHFKIKIVSVKCNSLLFSNPDPILLLLSNAKYHHSNFACSNHLYGEGNGTPFQYFCLENPMDGGAWWAAVHGIAKSQTWVSNFTFTFHFHALEKEIAAHSSVLAWRIPGTKEPGGLPSMGSHRVRHDWSDLAAAAVSHAKLPVFVLGVLILLVHVPRSMRGVSSPCCRNLTSANIFWDHDNITGITLIEIFFGSFWC